MSNSLAVWEPVTVFNLIIDIDIMVNWQVSKQGIRWPESPDRIVDSGAISSRSGVVFEVFRLPAVNF